MPAGIVLMLVKSSGLLFDSAILVRHRYGHRLHHVLAYYGLIWLVLGALALWVVVMIARRAAVKWRCNRCHGSFRARRGETVLCPHCQARITLPQSRMWPSSVPPLAAQHADVQAQGRAGPVATDIDQRAAVGSRMTGSREAATRSKS
jgi:hypothetical protein